MDSVFNKKVFLYRKFYTRKLVAHTCSAAHIITLAVWLLIILLPIIVVFSTGGKCLLLLISNRGLEQNSKLHGTTPTTIHF